MEKVTAYKAKDGTLFLCEEEAINYELENGKSISRRELFEVSRPLIAAHIIEYFTEDLDGDFTGREDKMKFNYDGDWGWDCDSAENPIDKCVYSYDTYYGDDCCVFCGEPEERK